MKTCEIFMSEDSTREVDCDFVTVRDGMVHITKMGEQHEITLEMWNASLILGVVLHDKTEEAE